MFIHRPTWPIGPDYTEWVGGDDGTARPWVRYKLRSADWYIQTLESVGAEVGFSRQVGVEMALDGALAALCGAFDAAVAGLIRAAEAYRDQPYKDLQQQPPDDAIPEHRYEWPKCRKLVLSLNLSPQLLDVCAVLDKVDLALAREPNPFGWLTEVQRLRNTTVHRNTLPRHIVAGTVTTSWSLTVGTREDIPDSGRGEHPVTYLHEVRAKVETLTEAMLQVIDHLTPHGIPTSTMSPSDAG